MGEATGAPRRPACYFNTGCCSFGNGDITAIEIADGDIRLVRWLGEDEEPKPKALADDKLGHILAAVRGIKVATA